MDSTKKVVDTLNKTNKVTQKACWKRLYGRSVEKKLCNRSAESLGNLREMCSRIGGGAMRSWAEMRERIWDKNWWQFGSSGNIELGRYRKKWNVEKWKSYCRDRRRKGQTDVKAKESEVKEGTRKWNPFKNNCEEHRCLDEDKDKDKDKYKIEILYGKVGR